MGATKVWSGSAWVTTQSARVWNGSAWVPTCPHVWNGSEWVDIQSTVSLTGGTATSTGSSFGDPLFTSYSVSYDGTEVGTNILGTAFSNNWITPAGSPCAKNFQVRITTFAVISGNPAYFSGPAVDTWVDLNGTSVHTWEANSFWPDTYEFSFTAQIRRAGAASILASAAVTLRGN